ncbi:hypothetical protein NUSPORA_01429 [Nucleospora cyclopteri]
MKQHTALSLEIAYFILIYLLFSIWVTDHPLYSQIGGLFASITVLTLQNIPKSNYNFRFFVFLLYGKTIGVLKIKEITQKLPYNILLDQLILFITILGGVIVYLLFPSLYLYGNSFSIGFVLFNILQDLKITRWFLAGTFSVLIVITILSVRINNYHLACKSVILINSFLSCMILSIQFVELINYL